MKPFSGKGVRIFILLGALLIALREVPALSALADDISNDGTVVSTLQEHAPTALPDARGCSFAAAQIIPHYKTPHSYDSRFRLFTLEIVNVKSGRDRLSLMACRRR